MLNTCRASVLLVTTMLALTLFTPAAGAAPLADVPGTGDPGQRCATDWERLAPAATPDIAFLSHAACVEAVVNGIEIVPATIPPDGPPPIGSGVGADCTDTLVSRLPDVYATLTVTDLSGRDLRNCDLSRVALLRGSFAGADLSGANLSGSFLEDTDLAGANLARADLSGAIMFGVNLTDADLSAANLSGITMTAFMPGAVLAGANLTNANLLGSFMYGANLYNANLSNAGLTGVNLDSANLTEANLLGAWWIDASFENTIWTDAMCPIGIKATGDVTSCAPYPAPH